jgi:predicted DNA-binding transcriptional regulator AlpA
MTTYDDPLLTTEEAAQELRLSESFLAKERMKGTGPAYVKLGRAVRYRRSGLSAWLAARTRISTAQCFNPLPAPSRRQPAALRTARKQA